MKDLIDALNATSRGVADGTVPAGAGKVVSLERTYPHAVEDVWDALTNPERIPRWFLPVSGDLRPGGNFQLTGNAGGEIRVCEPPRHLQLTWVMGPPTPEDSSIVNVRLEPVADGTRLELEHAAVVPPEMWDQFGPGGVGVGWDLGVLGLGMHLDGIEFDPAELEQSPEMHDVMRASAGHWGEAYRASGASDEAVEGMVAATIGFYVPAD